MQFWILLLIELNFKTSTNETIYHFFTLLLLFLLCLNAQDVLFGAKAGLNISSWSTNADDTGTRLAYHLGIVGQYPIDDALSGNAELLFSSLGVKSTDNANPGRSVFNYISLPLLAGYEITPEISAHAGSAIISSFCKDNIYRH